MDKEYRLRKIQVISLLGSPDKRVTIYASGGKEKLIWSCGCVFYETDAEGGRGNFYACTQHLGEELRND